MRLSFSTKGWHDRSFETFCEIAKDYGFEGIELHNIRGGLFADRDGAFHDYAAAATVRRLYESKLDLPCIDSICELADTAEAVEELMACLKIAKNLHIPNIRLRANHAENEAEAIESVASVIGKVLPEAEACGVTLLLETTGLFCKTSVLRDMLERFASDYLSALWELSGTYFDGEEMPETVIRNLGAYVRHVHFSDAKKTENGLEHCLAGEGELPIKEVMLALRSVNYDGFVSLVWNPEWS